MPQCALCAVIWERMTYFRDLTPYVYLADRPQALNVGWLDTAHEFDVGEIEPVLLERLRELAVSQPVNRTRGFHVCELCSLQEAAPMKITWRGTTRILGSAEIWIDGLDGLR